MSDTECPTCGRDDFASEHGMKIHHVRTHGESIAGVTVECAWCGADIKRMPANVEPGKNYFCGQERCRAKWQEENYAGKDNPHWTGGKATVECSWCGADVEKSPAKIARDEHHFCGGDTDCRAKWCSENLSGENSPHWKGGPVGVECSWCGADIKKPPRVVAQSENYFCGGDTDCFAKWHSKNMSAENHPDWKGGLITVECSWCGADIERKPANIAQHERHFCGGDTDCRAKWCSENLSGVNNPNWEGGSFPYGSGFTFAKKEQVRDRQDRKCAGCGVHESEQPTRLPVHHIQKARSFDDDDARNDDTILVALCEVCHPTWEQMTPLRPQTPYYN